MSNKDTFDKWFNSLSKSEQDEIINHIFKTKLQITYEGLFAGPTGKEIEKGLFSGPSGQTGKKVCHACGRPV